MPRLPRISSTDMIRYLAKHGYEHVRTSGDHHILVHKGTGRRISIPHRKELGKWTTSKVLSIVGIENADFIRDHS